MDERFDIIYAPASFGPQLNGYVMARGVEAVDRTHALFRWLRDELGISVDPATMYDEPIEQTLDCGCEIWMDFVLEKIGALASLRLGTRSAVAANIECDPCEEHLPDDPAAPPQAGRDWNGRVSAWKHKPRRPDSFQSDS